MNAELVAGLILMLSLWYVFLSEPPEDDPWE